MIDRTYIISLPDRLTDRLIPLIDYLKSIDLDYSVFLAIKDRDGKRGLIFSIEKLFTEILKEHFNLEQPIFLILEDDCKFLSDPREVIKKCLQQLPKDFDMLFLGCNLWQNHVYKYRDNLIKLDDAYATQSIIYSKKGIEKVLNVIHEFEKNEIIIPYDVLIKEFIMPDGKCFCSFPNLTTQLNGFSDIEQKEVKYSKFLEHRFTEQTKHL